MDEAKENLMNVLSAAAFGTPVPRRLADAIEALIDERIAVALETINERLEATIARDAP